MRDGKIVQVDRPQAIYSRPHDLFVAAFIGSPSMNLVESTFDGESIRFGRAVVPLEPDDRPAMRTGRLILGIRPEAFEDGGLAPTALPRLDVHVDVLEELGADTHVCFRIEARRPSLDTGSDDDESSLLATESTLVVARVDPRTNARQGETIQLAVDPTRFHFFGVEDGAALAKRGTRRRRAFHRPCAVTGTQWS